MLNPLASEVEIVGYLWTLWEDDFREYLHPEDFETEHDPYFFFARDCEEQLPIRYSFTILVIVQCFG